MTQDYNKGKPVGWNLPSSVPVANAQYPYPMQPSYPAQPGYPIQPGYPAQAGYPVQPGYPTGYSVHPPPYAAPYVVGVNNSGPAPMHERGILDASPLYNDPEAPKQEVIPENMGESFSSLEIRHRFVRKVYTILTFQLIITLSVIILFTFHEGIQLFVQRNQWLMISSYVVFFVTYMALICCAGARRKWPTNMILLGIFTLAFSYLLGAISSYYKSEIVLFSIGITAVVCFLITMFAVQTKFDFTGYGIYLFIASCVLLIFGIIAIFVRSNTMNLVYSGGIVLLFSMYLIFDTQRIVGGRKHNLSAEEHITGALSLYLDVVNIFLGILGLSRGQ